MKIRSAWVTKLGGLLAASAARGWMSTLDYQGVFYDPTVDPIHERFAGPAIFVFWHEYILFPFFLRGHCDIAMLLSQHNDAEWLSQAARHMGFETVRGSTNRGGTVAIRKMIERSRSMNLAITPDGPRGPRRRLAPGAVYLASRLGLPIVPMGFGYQRPWRVERAWDRFAIPRPYARARAVIGPYLHLPADLDRDQLEGRRRWVEEILEILTAEAERWAERGGRWEGQVPLHREGTPAALRAARRLQSGSAVPARRAA
jgi:lysophospholipid acyltransferase (LPLAT)-like uncharacterized protein